MWCDKGETVVVEPVSDYTCLHALKVRYQLTSQKLKPVTKRKLKQKILLDHFLYSCDHNVMWQGWNCRSRTCIWLYMSPRFQSSISINFPKQTSHGTETETRNFAWTSYDHHSSTAQRNRFEIRHFFSLPRKKLEKGKKRQRLWEEYISTLPVLADVKTFCYSTTHFVICTKHFFIQPLILYFAHQEGIVFALE